MPAAPERILLVEDDPGWREVIADVLRAKYLLTTADSAGRAVEYVDTWQATQSPADLIILDLELSKLPGIDSGISVLAYVREKGYTMPCIIFTARDLPMSKANTLYKKYDVYTGLEKPGDMPILLSTVEEALATYRARRDAALASTAQRPSQTRGQHQTIHILFLAANSSEQGRLKLDEESRAIDQALRTAEFRDVFRLTKQFAVHVGDVQELLMRFKPDIVHFSGHGLPTSEIVLLAEGDREHPVSVRALGKLFEVLKNNIKCVVLNACYSEVQAQAIAGSIGCVVGMSGDIADDAAVRFAIAFYRALGYGKDIQTAFDLGCIEMDLADLPDSDLPRLLATGCDPAQITFVAGE
jgi:DNA-binding response OmpR family regulator